MMLCCNLSIERTSYLARCAAHNDHRLQNSGLQDIGSHHYWRSGPLALALAIGLLHCVSKKRHPFYICDSSVMCHSIFVLNFLGYVSAKNYQNRVKSDKDITKNNGEW